MRRRFSIKCFCIGYLALLYAFPQTTQSRISPLTLISRFNASHINNTIACSSPVSNYIFISSQHVATIIDSTTNSIVLQTAYPFDASASCILLCMGMGLDASGFDVYLVGFTDKTWSVPYVAFYRASSPPEWTMYTLPKSFDALGGYAIDPTASRFWLTTANSVKMLRYSLGSPGNNVTITPLSSVETTDNDTWYLRFISATNQLFVVTTDLAAYSRISEIALLADDKMLLLKNQSAIVSAAFPYYFAPTCTRDGCSLSEANRSPKAFVIATNTHVFTVTYSSSPSSGNFLTFAAADVLALPRAASQQGCSCPVTGFMFLGDASGRWTCIDTLVVPARIVNTDFVGNSWQGNKAPQMLGGPAGPWQDYAHACAIGNLKVFLAGVFKMNADLAPYNAIAMLDLPIAPTSAWLTPAKIAAIACACTVHFLNILAVAVFVRRSQWCVRSLWPSCHWALAAVVMSVIVWIPLLVCTRRVSGRHQQLRDKLAIVS